MHIGEFQHVDLLIVHFSAHHNKGVCSALGVNEVSLSATVNVDASYVLESLQGNDRSCIRLDLIHWKSALAMLPDAIMYSYPPTDDALT